MGVMDRLFGRSPETAPSVPDRIEPGVENISGQNLLDIIREENSGIRATETTAMRVAAVYACVQLIAGVISSLPLSVFKRDASGTPEGVQHPYWYLFNESACSEYISAAMWEHVIASKLLRGDGLAWLQRNGRGEITGVYPLNRDATEVQRQAGGWRSYTFWLPDGTVRSVHEDDVLHLASLGFNGLRSPSTIQEYAGRTAVSQALAQDQYAQNILAQGNHSDMLVTTSAKLGEDQKRAIADDMYKRYHGLDHAGKPMVLSGAEFKVDRLRISPVDLQLIEARQFSVIEICRIFGVPPHMIGATDKSTSWGSGVESMTLGFLKYTLKPHLVGFRQEINRKVFPANSDLFFDYDLESLLEGDSAAQAAFFSKALGGPGSQGWMTINEVRRRKNLPPIPGGEKLILSGASNVQKSADPAQESGAVA